MANKELRYLLWDGRIDGAFDCTARVATTATAFQQPPRSLTSLVVSVLPFGLHALSGQVTTPGVSVRIRSVPASFVPGQAPFVVGVDLKNASHIQSLLFRVVGKGNTPMYEEVLRGPQIGMLPVAAPAWAAPIPLPTLARDEWAPFRAVVWVSSSPTAFDAFLWPRGLNRFVEPIAQHGKVVDDQFFDAEAVRKRKSAAGTPGPQIDEWIGQKLAKIKAATGIGKNASWVPVRPQLTLPTRVIAINQWRDLKVSTSDRAFTGDCTLTWDDTVVNVHGWPPPPVGLAALLLPMAAPPGRGVGAGIPVKLTPPLTIPAHQLSSGLLFSGVPFRFTAIAAAPSSAVTATLVGGHDGRPVGAALTENVTCVRLQLRHQVAGLPEVDTDPAVPLTFTKNTRVKFKLVETPASGGGAAATWAGEAAGMTGLEAQVTFRSAGAKTVSVTYLGVTFDVQVTVDVEVLETKVKMFGFEWEFGGFVVVDLLGDVVAPNELANFDSPKTVSFAEVGNIKWTTDDPDPGNPPRWPGHTLELVTKPVTTAGLGGLMNDLRTTLTLLKEIMAVDVVEKIFMTTFVHPPGADPRPLRVKCETHFSPPHHVGDARFTMQPRRTQPPHVGAPARIGLIGDHPLHKVGGQHCTFPIRFGRYHQDAGPRSKGIDAINALLLKTAAFMPWDGLDDQAKDVLFIYVMRLWADNNKDNQNPLVRPAISDLFHAIRDDAQREKFRLLRQHGGNFAKVSAVEADPFLRKFWIEYNEPYNFGANPEFGETKGQNDPVLHPTPVEYSTRRDKYSPYLSGPDTYFLVEDRAMKFIRLVLLQPDGTPENQAEILGDLNPFLQ